MLFEQALPHILKYEGGYANNPNDPGGATMKGITQRVYDAWRRRRGLAARPVRQIEDSEVAAIYRENYWDEVRCDELPAFLRLPVFDCGVNCGTGTAVRLLQEAAGTEADGKLGPATLAAVNAAQSFALLETFLWLRARYYARITAKNHKLEEFLAGWLFRLIAVRNAALS